MALRAAGRGLWRVPLQTRLPVFRGAWGQAAFLSSDSRFVDGGGAGGEPLRNDYLIACDRIDAKHGAKVFASVVDTSNALMFLAECVA